MAAGNRRRLRLNRRRLAETPIVSASSSSDLPLPQGQAPQESKTPNSANARHVPAKRNRSPSNRRAVHRAPS